MHHVHRTRRWGAHQNGKQWPRAAQHCEQFFAWYNLEHRHSGIGLHTPFDVHHGHAHAVREKRQIVLNGAYQLHPERFVKRPPSPPPLPDAVWINKPNEEEPTTH